MIKIRGIYNYTVFFILLKYNMEHLTLRKIRLFFKNSHNSLFTFKISNNFFHSFLYDISQLHFIIAIIIVQKNN